MLPFVYSITPFATLRCLEQIKIDLCYNYSKVVVVGVGGGFAYGPNGATHHGIDDIGVLSCLPGLTLLTPADPHEVRLCVQAAANLDGPCYLRLGRNREPNMFPSMEKTPDILRPATVRDGKDGLILTYGFILDEVLKASVILERDGINAEVVRITTLRPFPSEFVREIVGNGLPVLTVEEHVGVGGLGHETARIVAEEGRGNRFSMLAIPLGFPHACFDRATLLARSGLDADSIADSYRRLWSTKIEGTPSGA
jgi:transketolase